ncbi:MAG: hypothetical protein VKN60_08295 [Cyanobacteriota bacterium]|nr:hypothetical protein [Cyanobacteriota bacterium]
MTALYRRLGGIGLTRATTLLPDWWRDEFEEQEGAVFEAAAYIARRTGLTFRRRIKLQYPKGSETFWQFMRTSG